LRDLLSHADAVDLISRFSFTLRDDFVGFAIEERADLHLEVVDVLGGPTGLGLGWYE
jgi:hypothetical protein